MMSFKEFFKLHEIAVDSWLEPKLQPTSGLVAVYNGPIEGIHRGGEEPIGSIKSRINPVYAPVSHKRRKNLRNQSSSSSSKS